MNDRRRKHGHAKKGSNSPSYRSWYNMRTRCENSKATKFAFYGGRGITICERWKDFELFLADVGERPSLKHTLDRFPDRNGNYEPGNVRWATQTSQCRNKRNNRPVMRGDGVLYPTMTDAAEAVGGSHKLIWDVCNGKQKTYRGFAWRYA